MPPPAPSHPPHTHDAIAAVASGWGRSPRAIIRLTGPGTRPLCARLFHRVPDEGGHVIATRLRLTDALSFPCLLLWYLAPHSYTGEDAAEIILPGNPALLERVMARLCAEPDVREAGPGEFSARAYLGGKMSLDQAEGIAALIAAGDESQLAAAADLMAGRTGSTYRAWTDETATLLALVEAGIDFTDQEDVVPIPPPDLARRLLGLISAMDAVLGSSAGTEQLSGSPRVVLVGPPNAGKRTLFNALLGRQRTLVSPVAGTTRDAIAEDLNLSRPPHSISSGPTITLIDLAGLDDAPTGEIDSQAQRQVRAEIERAAVILHCDPRSVFHRAAFPATAQSIRVRTKADLPGAFDSSPSHRLTLSPPHEIGVCALDGWNLGVLKRAIADAAWSARRTGGAWLLPRHRRTLTAARDQLRAALSNVQPNAHALASPELIAGDLRAALDHLGELVGHISPDDVIGRIFATFCVGK